jgi:hypothetical protein
MTRHPRARVRLVDPVADTAAPAELDELDALIGVAAGELLQWGWLAGQLADWISDLPSASAADYQQKFPHGPTAAQAGWMLEHISERIGALLDGDRGQP